MDDDTGVHVSHQGRGYETSTASISNPCDCLPTWVLLMWNSVIHGTWTTDCSNKIIRFKIPYLVNYTLWNYVFKLKNISQIKLTTKFTWAVRVTDHKKRTLNAHERKRTDSTYSRGNDVKSYSNNHYTLINEQATCYWHRLAAINLQRS